MPSLRPLSTFAVSPNSVLAQRAPGRGYEVVRLPNAWAEAALLAYFKAHQSSAQLLENLPPHLAQALPSLQTHWVVQCHPQHLSPLGLVFERTVSLSSSQVLGVWPRHEVWLKPVRVSRLLQALELVKPHPLDARGLPLPWYEAPQSTQQLSEDEFEFHPEDLTRASSPPEGPLWELFHTHYLRLCQLAGFSPPPYLRQLSPRERGGLCTGKVYFQSTGPQAYQPLRILLGPCPNSDLAELLATAIHELAHPLSRGRRHDSHFHDAMIELASTAFGAEAMQPLRAQLGSPTARLDIWLASCLRSALRQEAPPQPADLSDELAMARALSRHRKLRALARDQQGKPEGIAAQAAANDLVARFELPSYDFHPELPLDDEALCDRWVPLRDQSLWRRILAFAVAAHYGVFALALAKPRCMHFFGAYADVTAAEYLYGTTLARVEREVSTHLLRFKQARRRSSAEVLSERVSFCTSAVVAFRDKLKALAQEEPSLAKRLEQAEDFAFQAHEARGLQWQRGRRSTYKENASGRAFGASLEPTEGLRGQGQAALPVGFKRV